MDSSSSSSSRFAKDIVWYDPVTSDKVIVLVYGKQGSGKTHFAGTFPSPFLLDVERGAKTLAQMGVRVPGYQIPRSGTVYTKIIALLSDIKARKPPFDTVETLIVDSLSELSEVLFQELIGWPASGVIEDKRGDASYDAYGRLKQQLLSFVRRIQDLDLHVVVTAGVQGDSDEVESQRVAEPRILGSYRHVVGHDFDEVYFAEAHRLNPQQPVEYRLHPVQYKWYPAKSRSGITEIIRDPSYTKLANYYARMLNGEK